MGLTVVAVLDRGTHQFIATLAATASPAQFDAPPYANNQCRLVSKKFFFYWNGFLVRLASGVLILNGSNCGRWLYVS